MASYIGTSGWAYRAWQPEFYPEKLPQKKYLEFYASQLTAVEVNYSFRRLIAEATMENWIASTPPGFQFCVKAHQRITHFMRLKGAGQAVQDFLASLNPLARAGKLGAVLFQLPPNLKADERLLAEFLEPMPRSFRAAIEFRHESWFDGKIFDLLRAREVALCVAESEEFVTPEVQTAHFSYFRFRKPEYSERELRKVAGRIRTHLEGGDAYAFFKHEESPESPLRAKAVLQMVSSPAEGRKGMPMRMAGKGKPDENVAERSRKLAERAAQVQRKAEAAHEGVEKAHARLDRLHQDIREMKERARANRERAAEQVRGAAKPRKPRRAA